MDIMTQWINMECEGGETRRKEKTGYINPKFISCKECEGEENEEPGIEGKMGVGRRLQLAKQAKPNNVRHMLFSWRLIMFRGIKIQWSLTHDFQFSHSDPVYPAWELIRETSRKTRSYVGIPAKFVR